MKKYGSKTEYFFVTTYKGYAIIKVVVTYVSKFNEQKYTHYIACLVGEGEDGFMSWRKAQNRIHNSYSYKVDEVKHHIDLFISGETPIITDADNAKYVTGYNRKHEWAFNRNTLLATMRSHKKGDAKMKILMQDRLEDANFHGYCGDLWNNDYDAFIDRLNEEFPLTKYTD